MKSSNSGDMKTPYQAAAFVYNNDVYYKPSIQGDVINRITKNGKIIFNSKKSHIRLVFHCIWQRIYLSMFYKLYIQKKNGNLQEKNVSKRKQIIINDQSVFYFFLTFSRLLIHLQNSILMSKQNKVSFL